MFKLPFMKRFDAIALPWGIYARPEAVPISPQLYRHECAHMLQWKRGWYLGFLFMYLFYFSRGLLKCRSFQEAYWNNPYEIEARNSEL